MVNRGFILASFLAIVFISMGCAGPSRLEIDYGTSFKLTKFNQMLNPEAEKSIESAMGFDGKAAQVVMEKYRKDFEKPAPALPFTLNIGTLGKK